MNFLKFKSIEIVTKRLGWIIIALPVFLTFIYVNFLSAKIYQAESKVIIKENAVREVPGLPGLAQGLLNVGNQTSREDGIILRSYLASAEFIETLEKNTQLRDHFSDQSLDFVGRLSSPASKEEFIDYICGKIGIHIEGSTSMVTIQTRAFNPNKALEINRYILKKSEEQINAFSKEILVSQTVYAELGIKEAENNLLNAKQKLLVFQNKHETVDPKAESTSLFSRIATLEQKILEAETSYKVSNKYLKDNSLQLQSKIGEIEALKEQLNEELKGLSTEDQTGFNDFLFDFERLKTEYEFAMNVYTAAFATLEKAKQEANQKRKFLLVISHPVIPEDFVKPKVGKTTLTVLLLACILYGIVRLLIATIQDHAL